MSSDADSEHLVERVRAGDRGAVDALFDRYRARLRRMVELRLNRKLWGRVDPSDIVQDTMLQAARRVDDYARDPQLPAYLWLRTLAQQQLLAVHRHHLGTLKRDAAMEITIGGDIGVSSASLAQVAVADATSPSSAAANAEQVVLLEALIDSMDPIDREILALRHFEQLGNAEAARVLGIGETAAAQRFLRALARLREKMRELGLGEG